LNAEALARAGVRSTQVAELSSELLAAGVHFAGDAPVTLEEAVAAFRQLLEIR
jgi:hypothetical protein